MPSSKYESFPPCCQRLLGQLEHENRTGARNCEKGHAVSLEYARVLEAERRKSASQDAKPV